MNDFKYFKDILPKENPHEPGDLFWYVEDLLLSYKYGLKNKFLRDLDKIRPLINDKMYRFLMDISEEATTFNHPQIR